ncbi:hypothetical protein RJ641_028481 [Dillenia turbinata]|uniref:Uncharacterized protein n=1 Tax=Dillenia turbinata TaxID=194707 RepID=A0AAN8VZA7_9MAGN
MCPLRLILMFLSIALAGFMAPRNLRSWNLVDSADESDQDSLSIPSSEKVKSCLGRTFWILVEITSGKYLWKNLVSTPSHRS